MSSSAFAVDIGALRQASQALTNLSTSLQGADQGTAPALQTLSHDGLKQALSSFGTNWSVKRASITAQLEQLASYLQDAADAYATTDAALATFFGDAR